MIRSNTGPMFNLHISISFVELQMRIHFKVNLHSRVVEIGKLMRVTACFHVLNMYKNYAYLIELLVLLSN